MTLIIFRVADLAAALLDSLLEHPGVILGVTTVLTIPAILLGINRFPYLGWFR
jgi:hypothetical protein